MYTNLCVNYILILSAIFGPLCNSIIHVFMYLYYGLAALGPKYRKFTWWKKYMTTMQLVRYFDYLFSYY